jgi:hypothetical protein
MGSGERNSIMERLGSDGLSWNSSFFRIVFVRRAHSRI